MFIDAALTPPGTKEYAMNATHTTASEMIAHLNARIDAALAAKPAKGCEESFSAHRDEEVASLRRQVAEIEAAPAAFERDARAWAAQAADVGAAFGL
jgi:hypothetical protein